jgi:hypothetical protein
MGLPVGLHAVLDRYGVLLVLSEVEDGVTELGCHPRLRQGARDSSDTIEREHEVRTLTDARVRERVDELGIELIGRSELP